MCKNHKHNPLYLLIVCAFPVASDTLFAVALASCFTRSHQQSLLVAPSLISTGKCMWLVNLHLQSLCVHAHAPFFFIWTLFHSFPSIFVLSSFDPLFRIEVNFSLPCKVPSFPSQGIRLSRPLSEGPHLVEIGQEVGRSGRYQPTHLTMPIAHYTSLFAATEQY